MIRRREFITLLGGAAAWPLAARAQGERMRRIGVLMPLVQNSTVAQARIAALSQALHQLGWNVGRNLTVEVRYAGPYAAGVRKHAADLVALGPDVILTTGSATVGPLLEPRVPCPSCS
jgi:putative ABC transport system substrate-binding protein